MLKITIEGPRGSGKTLLMRRITAVLQDCAVIDETRKDGKRFIKGPRGDISSKSYNTRGRDEDVVIARITDFAKLAGSEPA